jgi:predicted choloylglycine hydrolase
MTSSLLNEIKIEIRSLLISSQNGLSEDELCRDYSLFNSQRSLPYQLFGYSTKTDFLNSLTDILYRSSDGYIHPIVDQSTEHIFKFVQQQRKNKKKKQKKSNHQQEYKYIQQSKVSRNIL